LIVFLVYNEKVGVAVCSRAFNSFDCIL